MRPFQVQAVPMPHPLQASSVPLQAATVPATGTAATQLDISSLMNLMITMMIIVMMMKMMTGAFAGISEPAK